MTQNSTPREKDLENLIAQFLKLYITPGGTMVLGAPIALVTEAKRLGIVYPPVRR